MADLTKPLPALPLVDPLKDVYWFKPRCPVCQQTILFTYHSRKLATGTIRRRVQCLACGHKFRLWLE